MAAGDAKISHWFARQESAGQACQSGEIKTLP
jgi:hypothetical protein